LERSWALFWAASQATKSGGRGSRDRNRRRRRRRIGGNAVEKRLTRDNGEEVVVRHDNGRSVGIVQGGHGIAIGDRVRVLASPRGSRIERA
jgi:hypothetical protein